MIILYSYIAISIIYEIILGYTSFKRFKADEIKYNHFLTTKKVFLETLNSYSIKIPVIIILIVASLISLPIIFPFDLFIKVRKLFKKYEQKSVIEEEIKEPERTEPSPERLGEYEFDFVKAEMKTPDLNVRDIAPSEVINLSF
jgi:hypothetical protein